VKPLPLEDLDHVLRQTEPLWGQARGRRIFISGGTGFFGAWLLESLAHCNRELGLEVEAVVLTRDPSGFLIRMPHLTNEPSLRFIQGDVCDFSFPHEPFDFVIHGAAPTVGNANRPDSVLMNVLHTGTRRVLDFAVAAGAKGFLYLSSGAVYGPLPPNLAHIAEDDLGGLESLAPDSPYGKGKLAGEQMCATMALESGIPCTVARCFTFVGPHLPLDQHFAIGNFIANALAGQPIRVRGDGSPTRSYLYAADLAVWLWTMLFRGAKFGQTPVIFNVGSAESISIRDLASIVTETINPAVRVEIAGDSTLGARQHRYVPDVSRAEARLGLHPMIGLREAIRRTADWYR
jgi:dTDP-glucose 4,6-dehydratase